MKDIFAVSGLIFVLSGSIANAATTSCSSVSACVFGTNSSSGPGTQGTSKTGFGISGVSTSGHGVNGTSASSFGVVGITTENATSSSAARAGVLGEDSSTNKDAYNSGVAGSSTYGYGGSFSSTHGIGISAIGGILTKTAQAVNPEATSVGVAIAAYGEVVSPDLARRRPNIGEDYEDVFEGYGCFITPDHETSNGCEESSSINASGNAMFQDVTAYNFVVQTDTRSNGTVASFAARSASPTIEDFGTASLRNGVGTVALDKTFASSISPGYMVFVTPHGDSNSLYTTNLTPSGFVVRESKDGRSTLTFDYRIVAKPMDAKAAHMPAFKTNFTHRRE